MSLNRSLIDVKGVGDHLASKFRILGVLTCRDLVNYYPRRYDDYSNVVTINKIKPSQIAVLKGHFKSITGRYVRRGMHITEAIFSDPTGSVKIVWFNQPYREKYIDKSTEYLLAGKFEFNKMRLNIINPTIEKEKTFQVNVARIIPIYKETKGLKSTQIRKVIAELQPDINKLPEILPINVVKENNLIKYSDAISWIHYPKDSTQLQAAKERLSFDELFVLVYASLLNKQQFSIASGIEVKFDQNLAKKFVSSLPFELTNAQRKVIWQIYKDMQNKTPMNRLVEGDVGSGKTLVAAMSAIMVMKAGYQVTFMAPTEILARQHYQNLQKLLSNIGMSQEVGLLVGSLKKTDKMRSHELIKQKQVNLIVGTHALITDSVITNNLGLIIIDEQHRFGVEQRKKLQAKAKFLPHILNMTATPIPRTLTLTVYGELDVSVLDEMPAGRQPIKSQIISPNSRQTMYQTIDKQLAAGRQMFVVCPLITQSDLIGAVSAEEVYENLHKTILKKYRIGLLHGKMKSDQKDEIMLKFIDHELDILISTTVIEVGVDVPNATVMMIEAAERFGLAQLHQLRGRVGRGNFDSFCYFIMSDSKQPPQRIESLAQINDGFKLAELDLELRGPGAIYGVAQSGQLDLRIANISDTKLVARVRLAAQKCLKSNLDLSKYPHLNQEIQRTRSITNLN